MELESLTIYSMSLELCNQIWDEVKIWDHFTKNTIGYQLVRAADSIPANISEGYGRYHFKEQKQFLYYARGSLFETKTFIKLAYSRKLIKEEKYLQLNSIFDVLGKKLNNYIKTIGNL
jgi:four helix bundle protein